VTGVLAAATGADALADGLRELMSLRARWAELGAAARERVSGFTARRMADEHEALYEQWLS
jgi:glycosyltransferase involved in cell wall biosynthesis